LRFRASGFGFRVYRLVAVVRGVVQRRVSVLRQVEREFFIDNLLVRIHFIIVMIRWTGRAPWEFEFPFPGSLTSTGRGWIEAAFFSSQWLLLYRNVQRFRGGLVFKAHGLLYHSTLGLRVIKKKKKKVG